MPALASVAAVDTAIPGLTRRRVWGAPALRSHSLLALTFLKLYLAPAAVSHRPETTASILNGADLDEVFGPLGTVVDLGTVTRVRFDLHANSLWLEYPQPGGSGVVRTRANTPKAGVHIAFANHEMADEVYTKIWRRLGERVELKPYRRDWSDLGRVPLGWMLGVLFAATILIIAVDAAQDAGPSDSPLVRGLQLIDWRWIAGAGGVVLALLQVWIYRLLTQPPAFLELTERYPQERR